MSWENKGSGGGGPWGGGPSGGGDGGGPRPPDLEDFIRRGQDRFKGFLPGGGMVGGRGWLIILAIAVGIWFASGFYRVQPDQQGVVLLFGKWNGETTEPGLNWHWPYPIETAETPSVERINAIDVGFRSLGGERAAGQGNGRIMHPAGRPEDQDTPF